jgi:hypothetical protein
MKNTQLNFIKNELLTNGYITRNYCLRNYISRLGARIDDLEKAGWEFEASHIKTDFGADYEYRLKFSPEAKNDVNCHFGVKNARERQILPQEALF